MNSKFLNKKILIPLLCGIGCFTLTFLLTKAINHDEGKSLEITSRNKKLLSNLEEIDLEIISLKKQILGAKEEISALKSQKENLQLSLGVEIEETIETEDEEDVDLDLSLPEDEKDTSYYHYYEQEHSYYPGSAHCLRFFLMRTFGRGGAAHIAWRTDETGKRGD